jgi:hypothetical protein
MVVRNQPRYLLKPWPELKKKEKQLYMVKIITQSSKSTPEKPLPNLPSYIRCHQSAVVETKSTANDTTQASLNPLVSRERGS